VILPYCNIGRGARLSRVISIGRAHSRRAGRRRGSELDARRFRRTDNGVCLITKDMIERLA
jgi:glucose-1-phosphate adenylyltransferase